MERMGRTYEVGDGKTFLLPDDLRRLPSIVAEHEAPRTSSKYNFFSTLNMIEMLKKQDWLPVKAQEQLVRTESRQGYQKHKIDFRNPNIFLKNVGDLAPEIILYSSHDGLSAWHLLVGIFRLICTNGMVVADAQFGDIRFKHLGFQEKDVIDATYRVIEDVPKITNRIQEYKQIELKPDEKMQFAESALELKFGGEDKEVKTVDNSNIMIGDRTFNIPALLAPRRSQDMSNDLWTVFNIIQEKLTQGNNFERTVRRINDRMVKRERVPGIRGIDENIRVNKGLWEDLEIWREIKQVRA